MHVPFKLENFKTLKRGLLSHVHSAFSFKIPLHQIISPLIDIAIPPIHIIVQKICLGIHLLTCVNLYTCVLQLLSEN